MGINEDIQAEFRQSIVDDINLDRMTGELSDSEADQLLDEMGV